MSEFKVGDRIENANGREYTVTAVGERFLLVKDQKLDIGIGEVVCFKSDCTIIPDTIKVELLREDVVYWAAYCTTCDDTRQASRFYAACRAALARENEEAA